MIQNFSSPRINVKLEILNRQDQPIDFSDNINQVKIRRSIYQKSASVLLDITCHLDKLYLADVLTYTERYKLTIEYYDSESNLQSDNPTIVKRYEFILYPYRYYGLEDAIGDILSKTAANFQSVQQNREQNTHTIINWSVLLIPESHIALNRIVSGKVEIDLFGVSNVEKLLLCKSAIEDLAKKAQLPNFKCYSDNQWYTKLKDEFIFYPAREAYANLSYLVKLCKCCSSEFHIFGDLDQTAIYCLASAPDISNYLGNNGLVVFPRSKNDINYLKGHPFLTNVALKLDNSFFVLDGNRQPRAISYTNWNSYTKKVDERLHLDYADTNAEIVNQELARERATKYSLDLLFTGQTKLPINQDSQTILEEINSSHAYNSLLESNAIRPIQIQESGYLQAMKTVQLIARFSDKPFKDGLDIFRPMFARANIKFNQAGFQFLDERLNKLNGIYLVAEYIYTLDRSEGSNTKTKKTWDDEHIVRFFRLDSD